MNENKEYKLINTRVFHPAAKDVRERCEFTYCCASEMCDLYKSGMCVHDRRYFGDVRCPYGKNRQTEGFTSRAKKFYSWMEDARKTYAETLDKVIFSTDKMAKIHEYVFLPYPFFSNYVNPIKWIEDGHFVKASDFTTERVIEIIKYRPQAMFGGEIERFQRESVPRFLQHLRETFPELYAQLEQHELFKKVSDKVDNYIGRTAYVKTMRHGSYAVDCHKNKWEIDGSEIVCRKWSTWLPFGKTPTEVRIAMTDDMTAKITDNNQVCEKTRFTD